jgi:hypothetical protein
MADANVIMTAVVAFVAAFSFAVIYLGKAIQEGEKIDVMKFVTTLIVGVIMGVIAAVSGVVPTNATLETQYAYYFALVVGVQGIIKLFWNQFVTPPIAKSH